MRDLICNVINYCALLLEKLSVYHQIVIKTLKIRTDGYQTKFHNI